MAAAQDRKDNDFMNKVDRLQGRNVMAARFPWAQQLVRVGHARYWSGHRTPRRPLDEVIDAPEAEP